jgi:hypothetical protein
VLAAVNDKPFGRPQEGPSLTAAARGGQTCLRSGRKNACGAVEQKNGVKREDHKALAFQAAIRERKNARGAGRTKEGHSVQHEATGTFSMRQQLRFGEHFRVRQYGQGRLIRLGG